MTETFENPWDENFEPTTDQSIEDWSTIILVAKNEALTSKSWANRRWVISRWLPTYGIQALVTLEELRRYYSDVVFDPHLLRACERSKEASIAIGDNPYNRFLPINKKAFQNRTP